MKETYFCRPGFELEVDKLVAELATHNHRFKIQPWQASTDRSALIITDMQNYFLSPDSHAFIPSAPSILPVITRLIRFFKEKHRPVIFTRHINSLEDAESMAYWWKDRIDPRDRMSAILDELIADQDTVLDKTQYDAFYNTELDNILHHHKVLYPVICGVMTNLCCETTLRTAFVKGYRPVLPVDATAAYNRNFHLATFRNLSFGFCPVMTTAEIIQTLEA